MRAPRAFFATIDSTSAEAERRARNGECGPLWIVADVQSGGRARAGRRWDSAIGNLYTTFLFAPGCGPRQAACYSFVTALAVGDTTAHFGAPALVKWPNDVLVDGRKIAGILLSTSGGEMVSWLSVGIGINLCSHPGDAHWPATDLRMATGAAPARDAVLDVLEDAFAHWSARFVAEGFAPLRHEWLSRAARLGEVIEARAGDAAHRGVFEGLDEDGALILRQGTDRRIIAAADVHFPAREGAYAAGD